jgi:hypothetical protein
MASRVLPSLHVPVIALAVLAAGCDNFGVGGDKPSDPVASVLGNGRRISDVFGEATWFDPDDDDSVSCSIPGDFDVKISGVAVSAVDRFDEVTDGALGNLYVQDVTAEPGEYQGMTVFDPSFTPPDLRVAEGDVLDFFGVYQEFPGPSSGPFRNCRTLPEISGAGTFRFEGAHVVPKVVKLEDILGYPKARRYLGMLITLQNVKISADPKASKPSLPTGGRYTALIDRTGIDTTGIDAADFPQISNELYDMLNEGPPMAKGTEFKSLTGVVTYFYGV